MLTPREKIDRWDGARVHALRKWLGLSQYRFGLLLDVTDTTVYRWEKGRTAIAFPYRVVIDGIAREKGWADDNPSD